MSTELRANEFLTDTPYGQVRVTLWTQGREEWNTRPDGSYGRVEAIDDHATVEFSNDGRGLTINGLPCVGYETVRRTYYPSRNAYVWSVIGGSSRRGPSYTDGPITDNQRRKVYEMAEAACRAVVEANPDALRQGRLYSLRHRVERHEGNIAEHERKIAQEREALAALAAEVAATEAAPLCANCGREPVVDADPNVIICPSCVKVGQHAIDRE